MTVTGRLGKLRALFNLENGGRRGLFFSGSVIEYQARNNSFCQSAQVLSCLTPCWSWNLCVCIFLGRGDSLVGWAYEVRSIS